MVEGKGWTVEVKNEQALAEDDGKKAGRRQKYKKSITTNNMNK